MIAAQPSANISPSALMNHTGRAWNAALWPPPVQIHHLFAVAIPDPAQPAVERVVLTPHRHLPVIEQFAQRVVWQLAQEPKQVRRGEKAHGVPKQANNGAGSGGAAVNDDASRLGRPHVLCAALGDTLELHVTNLLPTMRISLGLVDDDLGMQTWLALPAASYGETQVYTFHCRQPGIFPIFNRAGADYTQFRCLLGVLMVEA